MKKHLFLFLIILFLITASFYSYAWMQNINTETKSLLIDYDNNHLHIDDRDVIYKLYCYEISNNEITTDEIISNLYPGKIINFKIEITNNSYRDYLINLNLDNSNLTLNNNLLSYLTFTLMDDVDYQLKPLNINENTNSYPIYNDYLITSKKKINIYFTIEFSLDLPKTLSDCYIILGHFNLTYYDKNN